MHTFRGQPEHFWEVKISFHKKIRIHKWVFTSNECERCIIYIRLFLSIFESNKLVVKYENLGFLIQRKKSYQRDWTYIKRLAKTWWRLKNHSFYRLSFSQRFEFWVHKLVSNLHRRWKPWIFQKKNPMNVWSLILILHWRHFTYQYGINFTCILRKTSAIKFTYGR